MTHRFIRTEIRDDVGRIVLDRPEVLNALDKECGAELLEALERMRDDSGARAVVLSGAGRAFSAGGDVKEMRLAEGSLPDAYFEELFDTLNAAVLVLAEMPKPVIAAVNGLAAGLGFNLALAADVR